MSQNEILVKLNRYQPRGISKVQWDLARGAAVKAVVECKVETVETARTLIGRLAQFLIWHPGWDRHTAPDLNALVTANFIETYCENPSTPPTERPYLRRVARAIGTMPPFDSYKRSPKRLAVRSFWSSVCDLGSFVGLAAAYQRLGYGLASVGFGGFVDQRLIAEWDLNQLIASTASAPSELLGTIVSVVRAAVNLRSAPDVEPTGVRAIQNAKAKSDQAKVVKPLSRTAAVKAARAAQARRAAATEVLNASTRLEPRLGNLPALAPLMAEAIAGFRPNQFTDSQWELVADATRQLATAYDPRNVKWVHTQMGVLARFCRWAVARPARGTSTDPLRAAELLVEGLVEEYLAGPLATAPDGTRATVRSVLHRALRRLAPESAPQVISYQPVQPPYTAYECASWVRLARNQPTATYRRSMSAIVALGLGAGLAPGEQRTTSPDAIFEGVLPGGITALFVKVGGASPRVVVVRAQYEDLLREALELHRKAGRKSSDPLYGLSKTRRNVTGPVTQRAKTALGTGVELNPARLRSTWLVAVMSADVPLGALLRASGLRTARTLVDLVKYCPEPDEEVVAAILREVQERNVVVPS
jgi:hypothetical protein